MDNNGKRIDEVKSNIVNTLSKEITKESSAPQEQFGDIMRLLEFAQDPSLIEVAYKTALDVTDSAERVNMLFQLLGEIAYIKDES